jgi:Gas vesicle synthesis protein GvpL/GvpF
VFNDIVREEQRRLREMHVECTGPWPAYDFVRMQFGA